ncbi:lipopolysaccharide biosynthesis protein [Demequina maris]|uniref:lipopolysaccharide biosynthesis protein n=1 Tax=Demequina maris TaxID=1638982 RepID=UPI000AAA75FC|nr:oligosaccharide flippase family protein [Demequina maris]
MRRQFVTLLGARGTAGLAQAAVLVLVARWMHVADYGALMGWAGALLVAATVADLGVSGYVLVQLPKGHLGTVRRALRLNTITSIAGGVVFAGLGALIAPSELKGAFAILAVAAFLEKNTETLTYVRIAQGDKVIPALSILLRRLLNLALTPLLYFVFGVDAAVAYALGYAIACAIAQVHARRPVHRSIPAGPLEDTWAVLRHSLRIMVELAAGGARTLDTAVVGWVAGGAAAGAYAAGTRLANPFVLIAGTLSNVLMPHVSLADHAASRRIARRLALATVALGAVMFPVAYLVSPLLPILLGEGYEESQAVFAWALPAIFFVGMSTAFAGYLQALGRSGFVAIAAGVNAPVLLGAVALGASMGGAAGAAIGLCASSMVYVVVLGARSLVATRASDAEGSPAILG